MRDYLQRTGAWIGLALLLSLAGLGLYLWLSLWTLRPDLLPQRACYDLVANRQALLKVERWEILGQERQVLFVHPAPSGSTALVYPVYIEPGATLRADLAVAPEAWAADGDGVTGRSYKRGWTARDRERGCQRIPGAAA